MKIRWFPYQLADAKAMEAELNRLAAEGWELKWLRLDLACFHRSGRRDLRYAVEPRPICYSDQDQAAWDQADRDYIQLCADAGWDAAWTAPAERGHQILVFQAGTVAARITAPLDLTEPEMLAVIQARLLGMDAMR